MARIALHIDDRIQQMTLRAMLQAEGHVIETGGVELIITDTPVRALACLEIAPVLLLTAFSGVPDAVDAMRQGVHGYILLPLQPGEAGIMVQRALAASGHANPPETPPETLAEVEARHIQAMLRACKHNHTETARRLGIGRNTLWRKLRAGLRILLAVSLLGAPALMAEPRGTAAARAIPPPPMTPARNRLPHSKLRQAGEQQTTAAAPSVAAEGLVERVQKILNGDPELARNHAGYLGYLAKHPEAAKAEEQRATMMVQPRFRALSAGMDNLMLSRPEAQKAMDQFHSALAKDGTLREQVEKLEETALQTNLPEVDVPGILNRLMQSGGAEGASKDLGGILQQNPGLAQAAGTLLKQFQGNPQAASPVNAWFSQEEKLAQDSETPALMTGYFRQHPEALKTFRSVEQAGAKDEHARDWNRYWRRTVQRTPGLDADYYRYLRQAGTMAGGLDKLGAESAPAWPPEGAPPTLPPLPQETIQSLLRPVIPQARPQGDAASKTTGQAAGTFRRERPAMRTR